MATIDGRTLFVSLVFSPGRTGCATIMTCPAPRPLLLSVLGAYGTVLYPTFDYHVLSLLERGIIYAVAHVRGGGMQGAAWHNAARRESKTNSQADMDRSGAHPTMQLTLHSVTAFLTAHNITTTALLGVIGADAGGLVAGHLAKCSLSILQV